jgi:anhydro-N-acetylmuramic acid kinase
MSPVTAIGLMSGTSHDGVDLALINTDGKALVEFGPTGYRPYDDEARVLLRRATAVAANLTDRTARPGIVAQAQELVNRVHAEAVETFLGANGVAPADVDVIGFHGQTVLHRPERGLTVQLGDGAALAARLGIAVVHDFRAADVAAGGQGAPLTPVFHAALVRKLGGDGPIAVLNIGGVANLTFIEGESDPIACDIGPGNALIDDFMRVRAGVPQDQDGRAAAVGQIDDVAVRRLLAHEFFNRPPPKSLDRNDFRAWLAQTGEVAGKSVEDGAATLTALTAAAIAGVVAHLRRPPALWIVAGGGARNPTLMAMLKARLQPALIKPADAAGWSADSLEAQAFAYLAVRSLRGMPITFPTTTGAPRPLTGGIVARP